MRNTTSTTHKIVISVLAALLMAVAGVVLSGGLHTDAKAAAAVSVTDMTGEYHQIHNGIPNTEMTAVVESGHIEITMKMDSGEEGDSDVTGTYWVGTFDTDRLPTIISTADKTKLDASMFGSQDASKTFTYEDGELSFPFSIMGMATTVILTK